MSEKADDNAAEKQDDVQIIISVRDNEIFVKYVDKDPLKFLSLMASINNGEIVEIINEAIPLYGRYFDFWPDGKPLVRPTDDFEVEN